MPDDALSIPFAPDASAASPDRRVTLEAESDSADSVAATLADLDAMLAIARSGRSAWAYLVGRCRAARVRADGALIVRLACRVWPSRADLHYDLDLPDEVQPGVVTPLRVERQYKTWVSGGRVVELPWRMERARVAWPYGCHDSHSRAVPVPAARHDQARIVMDADDAHGILAVGGVAVGYRHEFSLVFAKFDDQGRPQRIDLESVPVTARWRDAAGEEQTAEIELPIPACARTLLTTCNTGQVIVGGEIRRAAQRYYEVAYSTCTGKELGIRVVEPEPEET